MMYNFFSPGTEERSIHTECVSSCLRTQSGEDLCVLTAGVAISLMNPVVAPVIVLVTCARWPPPPIYTADRYVICPAYFSRRAGR